VKAAERAFKNELHSFVYARLAVNSRTAIAYHLKVMAATIERERQEELGDR